MTTLRSLTLAALAGTAMAAASGPAWAQHYSRIGEVEISGHGDHETQWARFAGPMEGLRLVAENKDVHCRSVRVQYGNGHWRRVFKGHLNENQPVDVDLNGSERRVRRVRFVCGTHGHRPARIFIEADIGRYANDWRRSPGWAGFIDRMVGMNGGHPAYQNGRYQGGNDHYGYGHNEQDHYGYGQNEHGHHSHNRGNGNYGNDNGWTTIGYETFNRRPDHERVVTHGWKGKNHQRIALRPHGDAARCSAIRVTFRNGHTRSLDVNTHDTMHEGQLYTFNLPGDQRNIRRIDMKCRGVGHHKTRIEVLAD